MQTRQNEFKLFREASKIQNEFKTHKTRNGTVKSRRVAAKCAFPQKTTHVHKPRFQAHGATKVTIAFRAWILYGGRKKCKDTGSVGRFSNRTP